MFGRACDTKKLVELRRKRLRVRIYGYRLTSAVEEETTRGNGVATKSERQGRRHTVQELGRATTAGSKRLY